MKYQYQKGFAPLVIILLVVLGIGVVGGGYVLYKDQQQKKKISTILHFHIRQYEQMYLL